MAKKKLRAKSKSKSKSSTTSRKRNARVRFRLTNTVGKQAAAAAALQYQSWKTLPLEDINPLFQRQMVVGQQIMLARILLKKGCIIPEHSHHNEQLSYMLEGALKFWIDGREIVVRAGEVLCIPANMPHRAEALEDTVDIDIFCPPRADWINKTDQYLRGKK
jgi:quercetin dioxygenase-like cupin family protein